MARTKLTFFDSKNTTELECYATTSREVLISIKDVDEQERFINLDISTAIKLAKTLRTQINIAKEINQTDDNWLNEYMKKEEGNHED